MYHIEFYLPNPFTFRTFQISKFQQYYDDDICKMCYALTLLNGDVHTMEFYLSDLHELVVNVY